MHEATTLQLSGMGVQGSILAPYATIDGGGSYVDGQVMVESLKGGNEYHPYFFTGCLID
jgi:choice-of-anchor A domain-containing protein